jgi:hypothetical protein
VSSLGTVALGENKQIKVGNRVVLFASNRHDDPTPPGPAAKPAKPKKRRRRRKGTAKKV